MNPHSFNLYLTYKCDCEVEHSITLEQAKSGTSIFCDWCNKTIKIRQVKSAKILINFESSKNLVDQAYETLKNFGYTKKEIKRDSSLIKAGSLEDFIKKFLELQEIM